MRWSVVMMLLCSLACARRVDDATRAPETQFLRTMPSPGGCYLQVWDRPQFTGQFDYINGPQAYADLLNMRSQLNWEHRIASVRSGSTAVATAFTERNFQGASLQLAERSEFATLPEPMNRRIASLRVRCGEAVDGKR